MKILAIESSCDETAAAVVENGRRVLSSVISSQADLHARTGGVVPEVAARQHLPAIIPVIEQALKEAAITLADVDAVAFSECPGLTGSLLVGAITAQFISEVENKPLIPVHHVAGHLYSVYLESEEELTFPRLILTVSGGHNELVLLKDHFDLKIIGASLDDSAGEAFDKGARLLGLGYPGGPALESAAKKGRKNPLFSLPRPMLNDPGLNMSFAGLKTALLYKLQKLEKTEISANLEDLAHEYQAAIVDVLSSKLRKAVEIYPHVREIHLVGGVSANQTLRQKLSAWAEEKNLFLRFPINLKYCTDNAAMIGAAAFFQWRKWPERYLSNRRITVKPTADLEQYYQLFF